MIESCQVILAYSPILKMSIFGMYLGPIGSWSQTWGIYLPSPEVHRLCWPSSSRMHHCSMPAFRKKKAHTNSILAGKEQLKFWAVNYEITWTFQRLHLFHPTFVILNKGACQMPQSTPKCKIAPASKRSSLWCLLQICLECSWVFSDEPLPRQP